MREEAGADDLETEQDQTENQDLKEMGLKVEQSYDIAQVATDVTAMFKRLWMTWMLKLHFQMIITVVASIYKLTPTNQVVLSATMVKS